MAHNAGTFGSVESILNNPLRTSYGFFKYKNNKLCLKKSEKYIQKRFKSK